MDKVPHRYLKNPFNNFFSIKSPLKSDDEFEKIDQRSVCSHYALYASTHLSDVALKETPHLLETQNMYLYQTGEIYLALPSSICVAILLYTVHYSY